MQHQSICAAFEALQDAGYFARPNFACCQTCGLEEIPDDQREKYVFYHAQDALDLDKTGSCYLAWDGNGAEIVKTLNANGVRTEWNGSSDTRIKILCHHS